MPRLQRVPIGHSHFPGKVEARGDWSAGPFLSQTIVIFPPRMRPTQGDIRPCVALGPKDPRRRLFRYGLAPERTSAGKLVRGGGAGGLEVHPLNKRGFSGRCWRGRIGNDCRGDRGIESAAAMGGPHLSAGGRLCLGASLGAKTAGGREGARKPAKKAQGGGF